MTKDFRFWFGLALLGLAVLFTLQNVTIVEVSFLFWTLKLPRAILLFVIFAAGARSKTAASQRTIENRVRIFPARQGDGQWTSLPARSRVSHPASNSRI